MANYRQDAETKMKKTIQNLIGEFNTIRTGRASTALFDKIMVDYYGAKTPLAQVANISIPEARLVVLQPWDKNVIGDIEKAILASELSLTPNNDGKVIRINIPPLTEERRKDLAKQSKATAEQARVAIRNIRRDLNEAIKKAQKDGEMTEDENKKAQDEVQKVTDQFIKEVDKLAAEKEKEIMEV